MDTSKQYIKMCKEAIEVQKRWAISPYLGDETPDGMICELLECYDDDTWQVKTNRDYCEPYTRDLVWMPRIDQLQAMVLKKGSPAISAFSCRFAHLVDMRDWWDGINPDIMAQYLTVEQLWLAFVMHKKYKKQWDNTSNEWVKTRLVIEKKSE